METEPLNIIWETLWRRVDAENLIPHEFRGLHKGEEYGVHRSDQYTILRNEDGKVIENHRLYLKHDTHHVERARIGSSILSYEGLIPLLYLPKVSAPIYAFDDRREAQLSGMHT
jgi:hypothetical protein